MILPFFLLIPSSVIQLTGIIFLLKPLLYILCRILRRLPMNCYPFSSASRLSISPLVRSVLQFLLLIRGGMSSVCIV
jgi:hypothetical protein